MNEDVFRIVNIELEGGARMSDDSLDSGGLTKWGFAQRYNPDVDVKSLTENEARMLAYAHYWRPMHCEQYTPGTALAIYDCAFNHGVGKATLMLQRAAGTRPDGVIGAITVRAIRSMETPALLLRLHDLRIRAYLDRNDAAEERFEAGWMNRIVRITVEAMRLDRPQRTLAGMVGE